MNNIAKRIIFLLSCIQLISSGIYGQNTPYFETPFYFEDAVGNKDSVIVGYDLNSNPYTINENFGEKEIMEPYDSIFEVRALHHNDLKERTSKKIIGFAEKYDSKYLISSQIIIVAHIKNKPLKVSYDISKFSDEIRSGSYLTHTITKDALGVEYIQPWEFFCLSTVDHHLFTFPDSLYKNNDIRGIRYLGDIQGNKKDTIYGIEVTFRPYDCLYKTSTNSLAYQQLKCFPTIGLDYIHVVLPEAVKSEKIEVANMVGQVFVVDLNLDNNILSLDINHLPHGMYTGIINQQYYFKFIKM